MKQLFALAALSYVTLAANVIPLPVGPPLAAPDYMVNNQGNTFGVAPDKGNLNGPVISAANISVNANSTGDANLTSLHLEDTMPGYTPGYFEKRQSSAFWMETIEHGQMPLQAQPYTFFRNVMDYGAKGDGVTDDTAAINMAASSGNRCGEACGSTTISGALVYFPAGTYLVSSPIIQYYYTQFVGNANSKPTLKGSANFSGIALIDSDVYIPGANGNEWYINQNQFYRQVRNFVIDLTAMPRSNVQGDQTYVPTGIHWQVAQATSLLNIDFVMPVSDSAGATTAVGIFMENGSGGFVSDLTFTGGNIGFRAGSQQFTARNLQFTSCLTAISMVWDWGFTWKSISVLSCYVALDLTEYGGLGGQGTGSVSVIDSHFNGVPFAITTNAEGFVPNIVLDNLLVENSQSIVLVSGGATILEGSSGAVTIKSWAIGPRYTTIDGLGGPVTGYVSPSPTKSPNLLDSSGKFFERSKPQYGNVAASSFLVATAHGISNDGTGDQSGAINSLLSGAGGTPVFFPAGIYQVQSTINVPTGSVIVGEGWSQIMGTGSFFEDINNPQVMVKFGNAGDVGTMEISDILFTVKGPTAGAILVEWNVQESSQGAAAMWDCHFRVGGALGTNLQLADCPKLTGSLNDNCKAASLLFHVTHSASGYFENVWAWVADHDIDEPPDGNTTTTSQINIYAGRGILIESQGPTWWYGTAAEHSALYQYQLLGANNVYLGHMQTETPYYQANPTAIAPYGAGQFSSDPAFSDCSTDISCVEAYALRVLNSTNVYIYSAGFYSFFQQYDQTCLLTESCQERIIETSFTQGLWLYNLFTKGIVQVISPDGGIPPLLQSDSGQGGYTTEISVWLPLALEGANIGTGSGPSVVYVDPSIWSEPNPTVDCIPPCIIVLPPKQLSSTTTISFPPYTTSITEFCSGSQTVVSTTIDIPPVTTTAIDYWNVNITTAPTTIVATSSVQASPFIITESCNAITTTFYPPPYPYSTPTATQGNPTVTYSSGAPSPTCTHDCGHECNIFCIGPCLLCIPCLTCFPGGIPPPVGAGGDGCETTITTECQSVCVTSPTSSCSSTCSPVIDCEPEPTNGITAIAPAYGANWQWPIYTVDSAFDESIYSRMSQTLNSIFGTPGGGGGGNPTPTSTIVIEPTGTTVNCVSPSPTLGGTSMLDCLDIAVGSGAVDPNTNYCTDTSGACSASGTGYCYADPNSGGKCDSDQSTDPGNGVIPVDSYCVLASSSECGFVVSLKGSNFGGNFPNSVCVTGAEISQFVRTAANQCGNGGTTDVLALQQSPDTEGTTWCLADKNNAGVCGA